MRYPKDLEKRMPKNYKKLLDEALKTKSGRAALRRYRKFTGLPWPTEIVVIDTPGGKGKRTLVGMGRSNGLVVADRRGGKGKRIKRGGIIACTSDGRQMMVLNGRSSRRGGSDLRPLGFVAQTEYVPTKAEEMAGTNKRDRIWVHRHDDDGGRWPKAYLDSAGNVVYGRGTYVVSDWIRR
jgi:hypothetical protein